MLDRPFDRWDLADQRLAWEQLNPGYMVTVGECAGMPVCVCVTFARIRGRIVAFYYATSQVVDHRMVEKWLAKEFKPPKWDSGTRTAHCDAQNFHLCASAIEAATVGWRPKIA